MSSLPVFNRVYRLEIQSVMSVFSSLVLYVERMIYTYQEEVQYCKWLWLLSKQMSVIVIAF
jgi:hypothetical protein